MMERKFLLPIIYLCFSAILFTACGAPGTEESTKPSTVQQDSAAVPIVPKETFWILAAEVAGGDMKDQINAAVRYIREKYPELEVQVDYIAEDLDNPDETEIYLNQLKTDIIAGNGPDVLLFPTQSKLNPFPNITQAMRNGHFMDIGSYYDADTELGKDNLNATVMDAGIWDGHRYVLPLRYEMSVYVVDADRMAQTGKDLTWLENTNVQEMMDEAVASGNGMLLESAFPREADTNILSYFPNQIDYKGDNFLLAAETLEAFWQSANDVAATTPANKQLYLYGVEGLPVMDAYVWNDLHIGDLSSPVLQLDLQNAMESALIAKCENIRYEMLPVRSVDDTVTAWVTWYGAVGSSSNDPEISYEYLRQFLTEEYQWELNASATEIDLTADGWPVRHKGAAEHLCRIRTQSLKSATAPGAEKVLATTISDNDLPFLDFQINNVYFPMALETEIGSTYYKYPPYPIEDMIAGKPNPQVGSPILEDPAEMTKDTLKRITAQIAEG